MKFDIELEIEEGDIILFNDEEWQVVGLDGVGKRFDAKAVNTGRIESFTEEELLKSIRLSGRFARIKGSYVEQF